MRAKTMLDNAHALSTQGRLAEAEAVYTEVLATAARMQWTGW